MRTAKSCGPDAPTLALRSRVYPANDGGKKARSPGRARISRKTTAWGMPDVSGASAVNTRVHTPTTKRTRGCGCIGHPAFPAPSYSFEGKEFRIELAQTCGEIAKLWLRMTLFEIECVGWRKGALAPCHHLSAVSRPEWWARFAFCPPYDLPSLEYWIARSSRATTIE